MNALLQNMIKLQDLVLAAPEKNESPEARELRASVPAPILSHFDRLVVRGKKGVAIIRNQVCTGCNMRVPIGTINTLKQASDIQLCGTCGRYLYLPEEVVEAPAAAEAPAKKTRKRKALADAV